MRNFHFLSGVNRYLRPLSIGALIAIVGAVACRDVAPTESLIEVRGVRGNICTIYPGPLSCACRDNPSACFADDTLPPIPNDSFAVRCFQNSRVRGNQVRCVGYFGRPRDFRVTDRYWKGRGFSYHTSDSIDVPATETRFRWSGIAVANTDITIHASYRDSVNRLRRVSGKASFIVESRSVSSPGFSQPRVITDSLVYGFTDYPYIRVGPAQFQSVWGLYVGPLNGSAILSPDDPAFVIGYGTGPNAQVAYWKGWQSVADSSVSYIHPSLSGGNGFIGAAYWYSEQTGPEPTKCSQSGGIVRLFNETARHEGATMDPNSHFGVMQSVVQEDSVYVQFERSVASDSTALSATTQSIIDRLLRKHTNRQKNFDRIDGKTIFGTQAPTGHNFGIVACRIVFDSVYIDSHP